MKEGKKYFDYFPEKVKTPGIPGLAMNRPLAPEVVDGDVGLELEIEGMGLPDTASIKTTCPVTGGRWRATADGSLRGEALEYLFSAPVKIDSMEKLVNDLFLKFNEIGTRLTLSNRCSTHVHLNVSSWKINKIISFFALWAAVEPALIDWCGVERKSNHFCLSTKDTTANIEAWYNYMKNNASYSQFREGLKYTALNPRHIFDIGSLEIRCGRGADNANDVINWTKLLWGLRERVDGIANPRDILELVSMDGAAKIIGDTAELAGIPAFAEEIFRASESIDERGRESFREAQVLCYSFPWEEWLPEINKVYIENPFGKVKNKKLPDPGLRPLFTRAEAARAVPQAPRDIEEDIRTAREAMARAREVRDFDERVRAIAEEFGDEE